MATDAALKDAMAVPSAAHGERAAATPAVALSLHPDLQEVEAAWRAFEATAEHTAFQSYDWLATWMREIGALNQVTPAIVVGRDAANGAVQFIFPMAIQKLQSIRRLTFLGSELCDYNAPLFAPAFAANLTPASFRSLWARIARFISADPRFRFALFDLRKLPETVAGRPHPFRAMALTANPSKAYIATLGSDWEAYYAERRSSATRKTERKQAKRLSEQGEVVFHAPRGGEARAATIDSLILQKRRALARMGADDIFDRPGYVAFYRAIASSPRMERLVDVTRLDVGSEMGAASVALRNGDAYSLVLSSYHDGAISQYGPGRSHLHALMRQAIDNKVELFDFTIGDEPYKRDWCDREVTLYDYLAPARLYATPLVWAIVVVRSAMRTVKQTPALWHMFTRVRAALGKGHR